MGTHTEASLSPAEDPSRTPSQDYGEEKESTPQYLRRQDAVQLEALKESPVTTNTTDRDARGPLLRYRRTPFWLAVIYLVTLIVPWVILCVLNKRPFTAPSYYDQRGRVDVQGSRNLRGVLAFAGVLRSISGVIVVPITSLILAQAVVAYSQRTSHQKKLNIRQLFALADRGWADVTVLWEAFRGPSSSRLLWIGAGLLALGGIQQPLQSALVSMVPIVMTTFADLPYGPSESQSITVGFDAEPWAMSRVRHTLVAEDVANNLATISDFVDQQYLWLDRANSEDVEYPAYDDPVRQTMLQWYGPDSSKPSGKLNPGSNFFVTSLANGTETGVLREHALRLDSSISCERISRSEYPSPCPGARPVSAEFNTSRVSLRACAPGELGVSPWTASRNRQDIKEDLYLDFEFVDDFVDGFPALDVRVDNFTIHCTCSTARGYFELGNFMNDGKYGPLIDKWPDAKTIEEETNDWLPLGRRPEETDYGYNNETVLPAEKRPLDPFDLTDTPASGPLMTSASALFGNYSFLQVFHNSSDLTASQARVVLCKHDRRIPFVQLWGKANNKHVVVCQNIVGLLWDDDDEDWAERDLDTIVASWVSSFQEEGDAEYLLLVATFLANRAVLDKAVAGSGVYSEREIFSSPGTPFSKPSMHVASTVVISVLILLQGVGMGAMVWYINRVPTWTHGLDAMALARIGKAMGDDELPPIGPVGENDRTKLQEVDALVGIADGRMGGGGLVPESQLGASRPLMDSGHERAKDMDIKFGLGAKGLITQDLLP